MCKTGWLVKDDFFSVNIANVTEFDSFRTPSRICLLGYLLWYMIESTMCIKHMRAFYRMGDFYFFKLKTVNQI